MHIGPRHQCILYEGSPFKQLERFAALVAHKLRERHRFVFLNNPAVIAALRSHLAALGIDVVHELDEGRLILSSDNRHLANGRFDAGKMLDLLATTVDHAVRAGYEELWVSGDMTWEFGAEKDFTKLLEYEFALDLFVRQRPCLHGICQYHQDTLPPKVILQGIYCHESLYINVTLSRDNPYFVPSQSVVEHLSELPGADVHAMLTQLC